MADMAHLPAVRRRQVLGATHECFQTAGRENLPGDTRKAPWRKSRFSMVLRRHREVSKREKRAWWFRGREAL